MPEILPEVLNEEIISIRNIGPGIYKMSVRSEYISGLGLPGQFVNVKCCDGINPLLRRPISICSISRIDKSFDLAFQVKGRGTELLSQKKPGEKIDVIGPLGKPFEMSGKYANIAVVGGGIGIFPLLFLLESSKAARKTAFLGFRCKDLIMLESEFRKASDDLFITTDDGSMYQKGMISDLLKSNLTECNYDIIYACGPTALLKAVAEIAHENGVKCQVCLEQRMGCGIGACLVCACKTVSDGGWKYSHVCKDGPVFWSDEVIFDFD